MAKRQKQDNVTINAAAEVAGRTLGEVARAFDSFQAQHPHPFAEGREALAAGQEKLVALASEAGERAAVVVGKTKAAARKTRKVATAARQRGAKVVAKARRSTRKVVKRAKRATSRARKTVARGASRFKR